MTAETGKFNSNQSERKVPLQSGMSVNANSKVREGTVMSIFTNLFSKSVESLKFVQ
jgi:HlyD family secretion protein